MLPKLLEVAARPAHCLYLRYADGTAGELSVAHLCGRGVFRAWDTTVPFAHVYLDPESGAVAWSADLDLSPHQLYDRLKAQESGATPLQAVA